LPVLSLPAVSFVEPSKQSRGAKPDPAGICRIKTPLAHFQTPRLFLKRIVGSKISYTKSLKHKTSTPDIHFLNILWIYIGYSAEIMCVKNAANTQSTEPRASRLAAVSVRIILLSLLCCPFGIVMPDPLAGIWFRFFIMAWIVGLCCGLVALVVISGSDSRLKGGKRVFAAMVLPPLILVLLIINTARRGRHEPVWYEARATAGTIATALRAYTAENGKYGHYPPTLTELGFTAEDLDGKHFSSENFSINASYDPNQNPPLAFTIVVTAQAETAGLKSASFDHKGNWIEYPAEPDQTQTPNPH